MDINPPPGTYIQSTFGPGGWVDSLLPNYTPRDEQQLMAQAVDDTFEKNGRLVAEAPTGTGKSLAYLVPGSYHAARSGDKLVVVTANIALQEQLLNKDLPLVAAAVPWSFTYALFKGRDNYLCERRLRMVDKVEWRKKEEAEQCVRIKEWARHTETGDVSELDFEPMPSVWDRFSSSGDECTGSNCRMRGGCHAAAAYTRARESDVLVTNYHILLANTLTEGKLLPPFGYLIMDEGHKAVDIARDFFGWDLSVLSLYKLTHALREERERASAGSGNILAARVMDEAHRYFGELEKFRRSNQYRIRLRTPPPVSSHGLVAALTQLGQAYRTRSTMFPFTDMTPEEEKEAKKEAAASYRLLATRSDNIAHKLLDNINNIGTGDDNHVYYLEPDKNDCARICSKMFDVAAHLDRKIFAGRNGIVITSATLSVGGSFDYTVESIGLSNAYTLEVGSPFDWRKQARLVVPKDFPEPKDQDYRAVVAASLAEIIRRANGRTLALFTSWSGLESAHKSLTSNRALSRYRIMKQGDAPRTRLLEEFRQDINSVLLGTESFWQGVDVQGESLSCLVIDKLPFPSPDDPIMDVIDEKTGEAFIRYSIPRAVLAFKQGFGRLIRSSTDRGVVVVLDSRIHTKWKSYGKLFVNSLPAEVTKGTLLSDVSAFLGHQAASQE